MIEAESNRLLASGARPLAASIPAYSTRFFNIPHGPMLSSRVAIAGSVAARER